ncbi:hypothetical protein QWJ34_21790 [Saccharibacillus sp. CPCC 101409]|uniref:hypothetical protein n=1 Tax=Saccharibacillus sp. CPCC 101409 TaxID=3058041 RepID=UPI00267343F6|nr:hypothetical protein [Saccharibacillus sp. CPCC 101409]MDO3412412.1 hypothetical protein [Saccharibacillus sp. CPCC 101409]
MRKKVITSTIVLTLAVGAGIYLPNITHHGKIIVKDQATYPAFTLHEMTDHADRIVYGTVVKRENTKKIKIPVTTEFDVDDRNAGKFIEETVTEVKIQVEEPIKDTNENQLKSLDKQGNTIITYNEAGGDAGAYFIEPEGGALQEGEKVIVFLNEAGFTWGSQGVLRVEAKKVTTNNYNDKTQYEVNDFIEKVEILDAN